MKDVVEKLRAWAAANPDVLRMWIFGSRAKGTFSSESDLDIAVEVKAMAGDPSPYTTFAFEREEWTQQLQPLSPWPVHLCHYDESCPDELPIEKGNIVKAVASGCVEVYAAQLAVQPDVPACGRSAG